MAEPSGTEHWSGLDRVGVCSWSLQPGNPAELLQRLEATDIARTQLALDPLIENPAVWGEAPALLERRNITVVSGMFGCAGENYTTLESIRRTGGIAPDETWERNRGHIAKAAQLARSLGLKLVTFHAGFVPHDESSPAYGKLVQRLNEVAVIFAKEGLTLGLETGQETAPALAALLLKLAKPNLGVNFDPANMILYDKGDPVEAVKVLGPWIRQVHIKDAVRTRTAGTWGCEVQAGEGEVDWRAFFSALQSQNYAGHLVIEREAGTRRVEDIRAAVLLVKQLLSAKG